MIHCTARLLLPFVISRARYHDVHKQKHYLFAALTSFCRFVFGVCAARVKRQTQHGRRIGVLGARTFTGGAEDQLLER